MMKTQTSPVQSPRGLTMIELMITLAVLGILATIAAPSMEKIIRDNRVISQTNELVSLINLTRNEAIRRNINVTETDRMAILRLTGSAGGWSGFVSVTGEEGDTDCPPDVIRCTSNEKVTLSVSSEALSFEARGFLNPFTEKLICLKHTGNNCKGTRQHMRIRVLGTGQIETKELACDATCSAQPQAEGP